MSASTTGNPAILADSINIDSAATLDTASLLAPGKADLWAGSSMNFNVGSSIGIDGVLRMPGQLNINNAGTLVDAGQVANDPSVNRLYEIPAVLASYAAIDPAGFPILPNSQVGGTVLVQPGINYSPDSITWDELIVEIGGSITDSYTIVVMGDITLDDVQFSSLPPGMTVVALGNPDEPSDGSIFFGSLGGIEPNEVSGNWYFAGAAAEIQSPGNLSLVNGSIQGGPGSAFNVQAGVVVSISTTAPATSIAIDPASLQSVALPNPAIVCR